jgi:beta-lactamase superfamily II metal-dependent hydrolase
MSQTAPRRVPAITLEALPASYGDALLVTCRTGRKAWRMLIDTGPDEVYPQLRQRLLALPMGRNGRRWLDLLVISHIDHDHIGGARQLLADEALKLDFGDVWFNAPRPAARGVAEGQDMADVLGSGRPGLPWNRAMGGQHLVTPATGGGVQLGAGGAPTLTLLSPDPARLKALWKVWDRTLAQLQPPALPKGGRLQPKALPADLASVAGRSMPDRAVANASSIAFLLEHGGASVLLCADAVPGVLLPALKGLAARRGVQRLAVDAIKLAHHGSSGNVTGELLDLVDARQVIVSTDGKIFGHPDDEALARVVQAWQGRGLTLCFNHDNARNRRWDEAGLKGRYGYEVRFPAAEGQGLLVTL